MSLWTEAEASEFFISGGKTRPAAGDDLVLDDEDLAPAPTPAASAVADDLVLDADDLDDCQQPVFQSGGGDTSMVAKEADRETDRSGLEAPPSSRASANAAPEGPTAAADGRPVAKAVLVGNSGVGKTSLM
jgi:hypothetical protein